MRRGGWLIAAGLALLCGCASPGDLVRPEVALIDVRPGQVRLLETSAVATVRLDNENPEPLAIEGLACRLYVDGVRVGKGLSDASFTIPRLGTVTREVAVHLDNLAMVRRVRPLLASQRFAYRLECRLYVRGEHRLHRVSVSRDGRIERADFLPAPAGP